LSLAAQVGIERLAGEQKEGEKIVVMDNPAPIRAGSIQGKTKEN
jgi:hypothetical protein